jgi:hypothetical protein
MGNGSEKKKENRKEEKLMFKILSALIISLVAATAAYAGETDSVRFMYSIVDNKNDTYGQRYAVKWEKDLPSDWAVDARGSVTKNNTTDALSSSFEVGTSKKFRLDRTNTVYVRPEIGNSMRSGFNTDYYGGIEIGYITRPLPLIDDNIKLKIDHAWIRGIDNDRLDGTLSRLQATYDLTNTISVGPRFEMRRGNVETDAYTLVLTSKF